MLVTRRGLIAGLGGLFVAPAIVRAENLMRINPRLMVPIDPQLILAQAVGPKMHTFDTGFGIIRATMADIAKMADWNSAHRVPLRKEHILEFIRSRGATQNSIGGGSETVAKTNTSELMVIRQ